MHVAVRVSKQYISPNRPTPRTKKREKREISTMAGGRNRTRKVYAVIPIAKQSALPFSPRATKQVPTWDRSKAAAVETLDIVVISLATFLEGYC
jgi:hypothetical protein